MSKIKDLNRVRSFAQLIAAASGGPNRAQPGRLEIAVVGLFEIPTALSHLTSASGLACVRKCPHAVYPGADRQSNKGTKHQSQAQLPSVRSSATATDAQYGALSRSSNSTTPTSAIQRFCGALGNCSRSQVAIQLGWRYIWADGSDGAISAPATTFRAAVRRSNLLELRVYGILQHSRSWRGRDIEYARTGGAHWRIALPIKTSASRRLVPR